MTQEITKASETEIEVITTTTTSVVEPLSLVKERRESLVQALAKLTADFERQSNGLLTAIAAEDEKITKAGQLGVIEPVIEEIVE